MNFTFLLPAPKYESLFPIDDSPFSILCSLFAYSPHAFPSSLFLLPVCFSTHYFLNPLSPNILVFPLFIVHYSLPTPFWSSRVIWNQYNSFLALRPRINHWLVPALSSTISCVGLIVAFPAHTSTRISHYDPLPIFQRSLCLNWSWLRIFRQPHFNVSLCFCIMVLSGRWFF